MTFYHGTGDEDLDDPGLIKGEDALGLRTIRSLGRGPGFLLVGKRITVSKEGAARLFDLFVGDPEPTKSISASST